MFWIIVALLILTALAFVLPFLLRKQNGLADDRREQNIEIAKLQLAELEKEYKEGLIEEISYQSSKAELEQALYDDLAVEEDLGKGKSALGEKATVIAISLFIPLLAVSLYLMLGRPEALMESSVPHGAEAAAKEKEQLASIDRMVGSLEKKLQKEPNNLTGWIMLGRTYRVLKRPKDALMAYEKADKLKPNNPDALLPMADIIATMNKGVLTGRPETLIKQALQVDPENMMGLWLAGMAAQQRSANTEAIAHWKKLEPMLEPGSPDQKEVGELIARAGGTVESSVTAPAVTTQPQTAAQENTATKDVANQAVNVTITLSEALKAKVKPEDTVFIYAKAVTGPPMPLAAVRKQVKDLPLEIKLDDSMAMMPQMKMSGFSELKVGARISLGGTPQAQAGDLFAEKSSVKAGDSVQLDINQVVE